MKALVITCRDPFRPANQRSVDVVRRRRSLRNLAPRGRLPVICQVNGQWISRKAWAMRVQDGDSVIFVTLPQGGGGGGSNPLKIVLMLVVMYFAPYLATQLLGITGAAAIGSLGVSLVTGAIGLLGNMLINALIPAPSPTAAQQSTSLAAASPTYSLGAQGNTARIGQPIPVIYGRHLIFPDFAAMPYLEYAGNEQYLYQLFCIGQGEYTIETIRVEDTPISSFSEITYEVIPPGGSVSLFPTSVTTSGEVAGQEALTSTILGPFVANDAGTTANYLAIDVVMSRGLYYANESGGLDAVSISWTVEAQQINDVGAAVGGWFVLGAQSYSAATTTPQRLSYKYAVASGRYQVRLTRTDAKQTGSRYGHELDWVGLRAYLPGTQVYGNVTLVAMRMRATNNLSSQASRKINMIVQRKLKTWNPISGWSTGTVPTRSIAWALADICRAQYGAALADSRIDLAGLHALDAIWASRGDSFNAIYDSQSTIMEGLTLTARAGRAIPFMQGGVAHVVRDQAAVLPTAKFTQRNIIKNSFKIDYLMASEETVDSIDVTYFDEDVWTERPVRATLPGGTSDKPASVKLFGVTNRQQAWREGMYAAACNRYRRRLPTFSTEMEGFIPTICDLIAVQHDMPKWGQSGEIVAWDAATKTAILSEPLDWSAGGPHVLAFRGRDGKPQGPYVATAGADAYHVTLTDWALSGKYWSDKVSDKATPDISGDRERSHYAFGPANAQYIKCRLLAMRPKSAETVEVAAVVESDFVHTADIGVAPGVTAWQLPAKFTTPVVSGLSLSSVLHMPGRMTASWQPAAGAERYQVEQSNGNGSWVRVDEIFGTSLEMAVLYGVDTIVRVAGVSGIARGPWAEFAYLTYLRVPPDDVSSLTIEGHVLTWPAVSNLDLDGYRIKFQYGANVEWGTANPLHSGLLTSSPYTMLIVPPGEVTIMIRAVDTSGNESVNSTYIITDLGDPLVDNVLESYDYRSASWPGTLHHAALVGGDIQATQSDPFFKADLSNFFGADNASFYPENYDGMDWISAGWTPSVAAAGSNLTVALTSSGNALTLEYRPTGPSSFYGDDADAFFSSDTDSFFDAPPDWMVWPGSITAQSMEYQWRVTTSSGPVTGLLSAFSALIDVPDRLLKLSGVAIGAAGTRLTAAIGQFNVIQNIHLTLHSGSSAMKMEIGDYSTDLGPMIYARDNSNALTTASTDVTIQGY